MYDALYESESAGYNYIREKRKRAGGSTLLGGRFRGGLRAL